MIGTVWESVCVCKVERNKGAKGKEKYFKKAKSKSERKR